MQLNLQSMIALPVPEGFAPPPGLELPPPGLEPPSSPPPGLTHPNKTWSEIVKSNTPNASKNVKASDSDDETRASSDVEGSDGEHGVVSTSPSLTSEGGGVTPVKFNLEVEERTPLRKSAPMFTPLKKTAPAFTPAGYSQPEPATVPPPPPGLRTKLSKQAAAFVPMGTKLSA